MTEVLPVSGRTCGQGHLHLDLNMGLVEVLALDGSGPAEPGELGTMVVTPFFPYRDCMPVFRYDTRDVVRRLPDEPLTCNLAGIPALSPILGKAEPDLHQRRRDLVTPRDIVEVLEELPCAAVARPVSSRSDGSILTADRAADDTRRHDHRRSSRAGSPTGASTASSRSRAADEPLRPVRADLAETTFTADLAPVGV